jgi:hypothetical protein
VCIQNYSKKKIPIGMGSSGETKINPRFLLTQSKWAVYAMGSHRAPFKAPPHELGAEMNHFFVSMIPVAIPSSPFMEKPP